MRSQEAPPSSEPMTLVQLLQDAALKFGDRTSILFNPSFRYLTWSYVELWEGAGRVASLLQERGLNKGDRVVIWGPNCPQWVLAFFGCLRAGIVAVPLDLRSDVDFARRVAAKTKPRLAFVSRVTPEGHKSLGLEEIKFEEIEELCLKLPDPQEVELSPDDLAEVMFTSGTTGDPKGVMLTHGNVAANVLSIGEYIPGKPSDRLVSILPLSHMFEQTAGLLAPLRHGASITYPTRLQPTVLFKTMRERRVTLLLLVPQALQLFMSGIEREVTRQGRQRSWRWLTVIARHLPFVLRRLLFRKVHQRFGGRLRYIVSGGAALDSELGAKWETLGVRVIQGYGATEASPVICSHTLRKPMYDSAGPPLPGVQVKLSSTAEILVKGPNVFRGYWESPEQTSLAFADGWYRTGDQGFFDDQGFLHVSGRTRDMIVLPSGQNVFPEDIEALLKRQPDVKETVVIGLSKGGAVEVHAVLLMEDSASAQTVVSAVNLRLAEYQQIRGFTVWQQEDFPRTHTRKVRKNVVLDVVKGDAPQGTAQVGKDTTAGPRGVRQIIAEVSETPVSDLEADTVLGGHLGLDSLKRVELLSAIEEELTVYVDETQVGPDTTVGMLEELVDQGPASANAIKFPTWGMSWWCQMVRGGIQRSVVFPLISLAYRVRVSGTEHLANLHGPVILAANHNLVLDNGIIIKSMPRRWRRRLAIAASAHLWNRRLWAALNPLVGNGFPFSKEGAIRPSLENLGRVLDGGWSVLIYPEGELTIGGPMRPFLSGVGLIAVDGRVPVVPLYLQIHEMGVPWQLPLVRRGKIDVHLGRPLTFEGGTSYQEATKIIEQSVKALATRP